VNQFLQRAELLFSKTSLLENLAKGSGRQRAGMHCYVSLSSVWMPQNFVAPGLPCSTKPARRSFASTSRAK